MFTTLSNAILWTGKNILKRYILGTGLMRVKESIGSPNMTRICVGTSTSTFRRVGKYWMLELALVIRKHPVQRGGDDYERERVT